MTLFVYYLIINRLEQVKYVLFLISCSYHWELNGALFSPSGNDGRIAVQPGKGTLIFARPIERDEGIYQCFASNKHGVAVTVKVDLRVGSK